MLKPSDLPERGFLILTKIGSGQVFFGCGPRGFIASKAAEKHFYIRSRQGKMRSRDFELVGGYVDGCGQEDTMRLAFWKKNFSSLSLRKLAGLVMLLQS